MIIVVTLLLLANLFAYNSDIFLGSHLLGGQYVSTKTQQSFETKDVQDSLTEFLRYNTSAVPGQRYHTNTSRGSASSSTNVKIGTGQSQKWYQIPAMTDDKDIKNLFSRMFIEPHAGDTLNINGSAGDKAGWNVTTVNLNGDAYDDIVIGAPYNDSANGLRTDCGAVYIYFGYPALMAQGNLDPSDANVTIYGANNGDLFGWSVANASHVHDTTYYDLIVGAPGYDGASSDEGRAYIIYGNGTSWEGTWDLASTSANVTLTSDVPSSRFGAAVGGSFDIDWDTYDDVVVGAPGDPSGTSTIYTVEDSGTSEYTVPFSGVSWDSYSIQMIYNQSDINVAGEIDKLQIQKFDGDTGTYNNFRIYMCHTTKIDTTLATDFETNYDGNMPRLVYGPKPLTLSGAVDSWFEITLDTTFTYNNIDHLLIEMRWNGDDGIECSLKGNTLADTTWDRRVTEGGDDVLPISGTRGHYVTNMKLSVTPTGAAYVIFGDGSLPSTIDYADSDIIIHGAHGGDQFGFSAAGAGNVTGTGATDDDLIIGAPGFKSGTNRGRAYVFYGRTSANWPSQTKWDLNVTNANVTLVGENDGDKFGWAVFRAGDVNDDTYDDVIIGAPGYSSSQGRAYIYFGNDYMGHGGYSGAKKRFSEPIRAGSLDRIETFEANGTVRTTPNPDWQRCVENLRTVAAAAAAGARDARSPGDTLQQVVTGYSSQADEGFGWNVTALNLNGDAYDDIIVGAPFNDSADGTRTDCGAVYIYFGYDNISNDDLNPTGANVTIYGETAGDNFGWSLDNASHVHSTTYYDLVVGAPGYDDVGTDRGRAYLIYGTPGWASTWDLASTAANVTITGENDNDKFGFAVAGIGYTDETSGGYADIGIGAPYNDSSGKTNNGAVYFLYGSASLSASYAASSLTKVASTHNDNMYLGFSLTGGGDINNDDYDEVMMGAPGVDRVYVALGGSGGVQQTWTDTYVADFNQGTIIYQVDIVSPGDVQLENLGATDQPVANTAASDIDQKPDVYDEVESSGSITDTRTNEGTYWSIYEADECNRTAIAENSVNGTVTNTYEWTQASNNSYERITEAVSGGDVTYLINEDFEADNGSFWHFPDSPIYGYTLDSWEWGDPTGAPLVDAHSGTNCWATDLDADYPLLEASSIRSPAVTIPADAVSAFLEFWFAYELEDTYDGFNLNMSVDGGTWTQVTSIPYDKTIDTGYSNELGGETAWCGISAHDYSWQQMWVNLTTYAGSTVQFKWHFGSDSSGVNAGVLIDDVSLWYGPRKMVVPNVKHVNDVTGEALTEVQTYNTRTAAPLGPTADDGWYTVDAADSAGPANVMYFDGFNTGVIPSSVTVTGCMLELVYSVQADYAGTGSVQWALDGGALASTGITPANGDVCKPGSYDLYAQGVNTRDEITTLEIEFTNDDSAAGAPQGRAVSFDFVWLNVSYETAQTSTLEHNWSFNVPPSNFVQVNVEANHTANTEWDNFTFYWSDTGTGWVASWNEMFTVTNTTDQNANQTYNSTALNTWAATGGTLYIGVIDTNRTDGYTDLDTLYVDYIGVNCSMDPWYDVEFNVTGLSGSYSSVEIIFNGRATGDDCNVSYWDGSNWALDYSITAGGSDAWTNGTTDVSGYIIDSDYLVIRLNKSQDATQNAWVYVDYFGIKWSAPDDFRLNGTFKSRVFNPTEAVTTATISWSVTDQTTEVTHEETIGAQSGTSTYLFDGAAAGTDHTRFQILYYQSEIAEWGLIDKLYFQKDDADTGDFNNFRINISHCSSSRTDLSTTFADNFDGNTPVRVYETSTLSLSGTGWYEFDLDDEFIYDNSSNLIVEIKWDGDSGNSVSLYFSSSTEDRRLYNWDDDEATTGTATTYYYDIKFDIVNQSTFNISVSADDGGTWDALTEDDNGIEHTFATPGTQITYQCEFRRPESADFTAVLHDVTITVPANTADYVFYGNTGSSFGYSVAMLGDLSGDGSYDDAIVGAPNNNSDEGAAYVYYGEDVRQTGTLTNDTATEFNTYAEKTSDLYVMPASTQSTWDGRLNLTGTDQFYDDFETDLAQWTVTAGTAAVSTDYEVYGSQSVKLTDADPAGITQIAADYWTAETKGILEGFFRTDADGFEVWGAGYSTPDWYSTCVIGFRGGNIQWLGSGPTWYDMEPAFSYSTNTWYHIQILYDNGADTFDVYVNDTAGRLVLRKAGATYFNSLDTRRIYIDTGAEGDANTLIAYVDEVRASTYPDPFGNLTSATTSFEGYVHTVTPTWSAMVPSGTTLIVRISRDGGTTWNASALTSGTTYEFPTEPHGRQVCFNVSFIGDGSYTPILFDIELAYVWIRVKTNVTGETAGDLFGYSVARAGDFNTSDSDSYDVIIGAPGYSTNAGKVYVFFGSTLTTGTISASAADWERVGDNNYDNLSFSVCGAGSVNGDPTYHQVLVGAPHFDTGASNGGNATLYGMYCRIQVTFNATTDNSGTHSNLDSSNTADVTYDNGYSANSKAYPYDGTDVSVWAEFGTTYTFAWESTSPSGSDHRWRQSTQATGTLQYPIIYNASFWDQYQTTVTVTTVGVNHTDMDATNHATLDYTQFDSALTTDLHDATSFTDQWCDNGSSLSLENPSASSDTQHRWYDMNGTLSVPTISSSATYGEQYYEQVKVTVATSGGYLRSTTYCTRVWYYNLTTQYWYQIWDGGTPQSFNDWVNIWRIINVSTPIEGPSSPRWLNYTCDDNETNVSNPELSSISHTFLFHCQFPDDVDITGESASDQFGFAVSGSGNLNVGTIEDIMIGAPYNDNKGAMYAFYGSDTWTIGTSLTYSDASWTYVGEATDDCYGLAVSGIQADVNDDGECNALVGAPFNDTDGTSDDRGRVYVLPITENFPRVELNWTYNNEAGYIGNRSFDATATQWYNDTITLVGSDIVVPAGDNITFRVSVTAESGSPFILLYYNSQKYDSNYEIKSYSDARVTWAKTCNNTTTPETYTNEWCAEFNQAFPEDVHVKARVSSRYPPYDETWIKNAKITVKYANDTIVVQGGTTYENLTMTLESTGTNYKIYNYSFAIDTWPTGLYKAIAMSTDTNDVTDYLRGESNAKRVWFRVIA